MCKCLIVFKCKISSGVIDFIYHKINVEENSIYPVKVAVLERNVIIMNLKNIPGLLVIQVIEFVVEVQFESRIDVSPKETERSPRPLPCPCNDLFDFLERILRSGNFDVYSLRKSHGCGLISEGTDIRSIETEFIDQAFNIVTGLYSCKDAISQIIKESSVRDEKEPTATATGVSIDPADHNWIEQVNHYRGKYRMILEQFRVLEGKLGVESISVTGRRDETSNPSVNIEPNLKEGDGAPGNKSSKTRGDGTSPPTTTYSLEGLLQICVNRLLAEDWEKIRQSISVQVRGEVLSNIPNGIGVFNELVNRNLVGNHNLSFLRNLFYQIQRVDLVHLMDCIEEGDYSLLSGRQVELPQSERYDVPFVNAGLTSVPVEEMQRLSVGRTRHATDRPRGAVDETADARGRTPKTDLEASDIVPTPWNENFEFSCKHYDRYCDVKFSCCERFWPCHRCHNADSKCGRKNLRSRDIVKIKCKRCGKIQEFPKERPNCVQCNVEFGDYFCPICKHLTGLHSRPYHCSKCDICRVRGDRSFHCDVCGVCLDINLQGNHLCRPNSGHDECCICFEDAFTGCQILPCSHKVHKDCANMMLRNGITRCPVCRESFAHLIEERPVSD